MEILEINSDSNQASRGQRNCRQLHCFQPSSVIGDSISETVGGHGLGPRITPQGQVVPPGLESSQAEKHDER